MKGAGYDSSDRGPQYKICGAFPRAVQICSKWELYLTILARKQFTLYESLKSTTWSFGSEGKDNLGNAYNKRKKCKNYVIVKILKNSGTFTLCPPSFVCTIRTAETGEGDISIDLTPHMCLLLSWTSPTLQYGRPYCDLNVLHCMYWSWVPGTNLLSVRSRSLAAPWHGTRAKRRSPSPSTCSSSSLLHL